MDIDFDYLRNNKIRGGKCVGGNRTHASCSKIVNFRLDNELNSIEVTIGIGRNIIRENMSIIIPC